MVLRIVQFLISITIFIEPSFTIQSRKPMSISVSLFRDLPPDVDRLFNISVNFSAYHSINSAFSIYLVNKSETPPQMKENFIFRPGSQNQINQPVYGKYFSVLRCVSKSVEKILEIDLMFNSSATNLYLLMFYSENFKDNSLNNNGTNVYESIISCNVSTVANLKLKFGKSDLDEEAFVANQIIWINCSASIEHWPYWKSVKLENLDQIDVLDLKINKSTKETSIQTNIKLKNHNSLIVCKSMNNSISRQLKIYHHPISVSTEPFIDSRSSIPYNVSITCVSNGGYPPPNIHWKMIVGPLNSTKFYKMNENRTVLIITRKAPPGSKWIFQCSAKNKFPSSIYSGSDIIISFNIPELGLEARKKVFFLIAFSIILILILLTIIKMRCCQEKKKLQNSKLIDWGMRPKLFKSNPSKSIKSNDSVTKPVEISSDETSSIYSIEKGLVSQTLYVLDENRYDLK